MPDSAVHESIYQNCEIHGSLVRRSGTRVEPIWPHTSVKMHILVNEYILLYYRAGKYSPLLYFAPFALFVNGRIQN